MSPEKSADKNPWLSIPASDYEAHMGPRGVDQDPILNKFFEQVYSSRRPIRLAVFGCGTGNGFEHIDHTITESAVGIDSNCRYLEIARRRYLRLGQTVKFECIDVDAFDLKPGSFNLIHCPLIFEYIQIEPMLVKIAAGLAARGTLSVVLQLPSADEQVVSDTGYESVKALERAFRPVDPDEFTELCSRVGLNKTESSVIPLQRGKSFFTGIFEKA